MELNAKSYWMLGVLVKILQWGKNIILSLIAAGSLLLCGAAFIFAKSAKTEGKRQLSEGVMTEEKFKDLTKDINKFGLRVGSAALKVSLTFTLLVLVSGKLTRAAIRKVTTDRAEDFLLTEDDPQGTGFKFHDKIYLSTISASVAVDMSKLMLAADPEELIERAADESFSDPKFSYAVCHDDEGVKLFITDLESITELMDDLAERPLPKGFVNIVRETEVGVRKITKFDQNCAAYLAIINHILELAEKYKIKDIYIGSIDGDKFQDSEIIATNGLRNMLSRTLSFDRP